MSGNMPYVVEKGPYLSNIESKLMDPAQRRQTLLDLRAGTVGVADLVGFESQSLAPDNQTPDQRRQHMNQDWFGNPAPSWWVGYEGDVEAIMREGMRRAIEVSLGLEYTDAVPTLGEMEQGRFWPIDAFWICQGPWFQCWVTWRRSSTGNGGHVTVLITTPAAKGLPLNSEITRPSGSLPIAPDYAEQAPPPPPSPSLSVTPERGVWVVGHRDYERTLRFSVEGRNPFGIIAFPRLVWAPTDPAVVCVKPSEREGGVLDSPRQYIP